MKQWRMGAPLAALLAGLGMLGAAQAATTLTRTTTYEYEPATGFLSKEIVEQGDTQLEVVTTYGYDAFGNRTSVTVSSPVPGIKGIATRTSSTQYDTRGQFPISNTNAMGHTENTLYEPKFGSPQSLTGPNGLTTTWEPDNFGRKKYETRADGTRTVWDYQYCYGVNGGTISCPSYAKYMVKATEQVKSGSTYADNGAWVETYYDALNREVRTRTPGFADNTIVIKDTEYDNLGRVKRAYNPYFSNATTKYWTEYDYDALGRVIQVTHPDKTVTRTQYSGLTTKVTNALNQVKTTVVNSMGQVVKVTDTDNNSLTYKYDPFGNLTQTTDPKGNLVKMSYNRRGHKEQMVDPDMGTWNYVNDVLGQLKRQTDAKSQVTDIEYDKLGRMTKRAEPDLVSTWTYDGCTKGIGKLCETATDNGYRQASSYDSLGRPSSTTTTIDTTYTTSVTYDTNGRLGTRTYPNGMVVKYQYTKSGYLSGVINASSSLALYWWQAGSMDAAGNLLTQTHGNLVYTNQEYDPATGRVKKILAGKDYAATGGVQKLTYDYDDIGRMAWRNDANQNLNETFLYDNLNRLKSNTVNSGSAGIVTQTYDYDTIGNIKLRSDIGTYTYGLTNSRPHAITEIALNAGGKRTYKYDANGNLTDEVQYDANNNVVSSKGRTEVYTSFNMPQALGAPGISLAFAYGPEHQRVKQIAPAATTIYVHPDNAGGLLYEKDLKADGTVEHRNYISAYGQVVAVSSTSKTLYYHHDHLGSVTAVTDGAGAVVERLAYEPFGKRRQPAGSTDPNNTIVGKTTDRGFTEHEHLDELGLIHMNGRIYDPALGRFMSADPNVPHPESIQSFNRYAYTRNNPLTSVDLDGFDDWYKYDLGYTLQEGDYGYWQRTNDFKTEFSNTSINFNNVNTIGNIGSLSNQDMTRIVISGNLVIGPSNSGLNTTSYIPTTSSIVANNGSQSTFGKFLSELDSGGFATQLVRRLAADFVENNKGTFGAQGWLAEKANGYFEKPDATSANGVAATVAVVAGSLLTPGGTKNEAAKALSAGEKFFEGTTLHPRVLKQLESADRHAFPVLIDEIAKTSGTVTTTLDSRGNPVQMLSVKGEVNGEKGTFEYIKNQTNQIYHRFFDNRKP